MEDNLRSVAKARFGAGCGLGRGLTFSALCLYSLAVWSMGVTKPRLLESALIVIILAVCVGKAVQQLVDHLTGGTVIEATASVRLPPFADIRFAAEIVVEDLIGRALF